MEGLLVLIERILQKAVVRKRYFECYIPHTGFVNADTGIC